MPAAASVTALVGALACVKVSGAGPPSWTQRTDTAPGAAGLPSSGAAPFNVSPPITCTVRSGPALTAGPRLPALVPLPPPRVIPEMLKLSKTLVLAVVAPLAEARPTSTVADMLMVWLAPTWVQLVPLLDRKAWNTLPVRTSLTQ